MFPKTVTMKLLPYTKRCRGFKDCMYILALDWSFVKVWVQSFSVVLHSQASSKSSQGPARQLPKGNSLLDTLLPFLTTRQFRPPPQKKNSLHTYTHDHE